MSLLRGQHYWQNRHDTVAAFAPMDLNHLPIFQAVAECSSFSRAAERLEAKRSSVSRAIAALERELGVQLFNRTTRSVSLTTAGTALYAKLKPQLDGLQLALGTLPEREERASGTLRVTTSVDVGVMVLAPLAPGFLLRHPGVALDARVNNRLVDLVSEGFDAALRISPTRLKSSGLIARRLASLQIALYGAPDYLARAGVPRTPEDLQQHDWVAFRSFTPPAPFDALKARSRLATDDMLFLLAAVRAGAGLGLLPSFVAAPDVASGRLTRVLPRASLTAGSIYLVHPPARHVPRKVIALRDYLLEHLARHPLSGSET